MTNEDLALARAVGVLKPRRTNPVADLALGAVWGSIIITAIAGALNA